MYQDHQSPALSPPVLATHLFAPIPFSSTTPHLLPTFPSTTPHLLLRVRLADDTSPNLCPLDMAVTCTGERGVMQRPLLWE